MNLIKLGTNEASDRRILILQLSSLSESFENLEFGEGHFGCFLAMDAPAFTEKQILKFSDKLLNLGMSFCSCWGNGCERIHDLIDVSCHNFLPDPTDENVIMTSWLSKQSLPEALWEHLFVSFPADGYWDKSKTDLFIFIDQDKSFKMAKALLSDLKNLNKIVVGEE